MKFITKLSNLLTSAIELPSALHACVEMAREADYSRHEMAKLPTELNEELEQKQGNLDLWRNWAVSISGLNDDAPSWQLRDEIKRKLADDDGAQICGKLAARITELEKERDRWKFGFRNMRDSHDSAVAFAKECWSAQVKLEREIADEVWAWARERIERLTTEANELARAIEAERRQLSMANKEVEILRRELNRELEARRWRKQSEEPAPKKVIVLEFMFNGNGHPNLCLGMYVARDGEWRYLSPEDMPDNQ